MRDTKQDSYQAANAWWTGKLAEIRGEVADRSTIYWTPAPRPAPSPATTTAFLASLDRALSAAPPAPGRTIADHAASWLEGQRALSRAGELCEAEVANLTLQLSHFTTWVGPSGPVEILDESRWDGYFQFLLGSVASGRWGKVYVAKLLRTARLFIDHLAGLGLIPPPRNLHDRRKRFTISPVKIEVFTPGEVRQLLAAATGQLRLHIYLMINTGTTQADISSMHPSSVDWVNGVITRKRSKTGHHASVPTVDYALWPETLALLKEYRSQDPERVLTTRTGAPLVNKRFEGVDFVTTDMVRLNFNLLRAKVGQPKSLKYLRKTSASLLEAHPVYGRLTGLFLGHAPVGMAARHYARPPQALLDEAVLWLREQYFPALGAGGGAG